MALTFLQQDARQREATEFGNVLRALGQNLNAAQQAFSAVRAARTRLAASAVFDEADLAAFDAEARNIALAMLGAGTLLSDLAGGEVAITVAGVPVAEVV